MDIFTTFLQIAQGAGTTEIFDELNPESEQHIIELVTKAQAFIKEKFKDKASRELAINLFSSFAAIESVEKLLDYKVYLNEYSNSYGKKYLQARTSYVNNAGKKAWLNAYVGPLESFPLSIKDPNALKIGRELIRKKLIDKGICKVERLEKKNEVK